MTDDITKFPVTLWNRIKNRRGSRVANCIVSGRYLKFHDIDGPRQPMRDGTPVCLDVMTDTKDDPEDTSIPDRKICELIVPLEELERIVAKLRKEVDGA